MIPHGPVRPRDIGVVRVTADNTKRYLTLRVLTADFEFEFKIDEPVALAEELIVAKRWTEEKAD